MLDTNHTSSTKTSEIEETPWVLHRRFDRLGRLVGNDGVKTLHRSHVMIIGLGGVGSWVAESLARSGVGKLTLIDFDEICITNTNRQLQAIQGMVGRKKADVLAERLKKINPQADIQTVVQFYEEKNAENIFALSPDFIIDAIDNLTAKCHLLSEVRRRQIPTISAGGSAGRWDPSQIRFEDLANTHTDPMLHQTRKMLRQQYAFPAEGDFGIGAVFSQEPPQEPVGLEYDGDQGFKCVCPQGQNDFHSCEKRRFIYGSASFVTGSFGLWIAAKVVEKLVKGKVQ